MTKKCEVCGRNFHPNRDSEGREDIYCSHKCAAIGGRKIFLAVAVIILVVAVIFQIVSFFTDMETEVVIVYSTFYIMSGLPLIYAIIGFIANSRMKKDSPYTNNEETHHLEFLEINNESFVYEDKCKSTICMICKLEIRIGDSVYKCPHCESYFHKKHLESWVEDNSNCPVCGTVLTIENE